MTVCTIDIYALSDLTTVLGTLDHRGDATPDNALQAKLRGTLNEPAAGAGFIDAGHPAYAYVKRGNVLAWKLDGTAVEWTFIDTVDEVTVGPESQKGKTFDGQGVLAYLSRATIRARLGLGLLPIQQERNWNWTAPEFDDSGWASPVQLVRYDLASNSYRWGGGSSPPPAEPDISKKGGGSAKWDDANAYWIGPSGDTQGTASPTTAHVNYYRNKSGTCNPGGTGYYKIEAAGTIYASVWLDGTLLFETNSDGDYKVVKLSASDHRIAIANLLSADGGVILSVYPCDETGKVTGSPLLHTDATNWLVEHNPASQPGMNLGQVWDFIGFEAKNRGTLPKLGWDFTPTLDSNSVAWAQTQIISTKVATDYLTFMRECVASKFADVWASVASGSIVLHLGVRGVNVSVTFQPTTDPAISNVTYASFRTIGPPANVMHVLWQGPDFEVAGTSAVATEGERIEARLDLGAYSDPDGVVAPALAELSRFQSERKQIKLKVEPTGSGDVPLLNFNLGDSPLVVNETGGTTRTRFTGYDMTVDQTGHITWGLEFGDQLYGDQERFTTSDVAIARPNA